MADPWALANEDLPSQAQGGPQGTCTRHEPRRGALGLEHFPVTGGQAGSPGDTQGVGHQHRLPLVLLGCMWGFGGVWSGGVSELTGGLESGDGGIGDSRHYLFYGFLHVRSVTLCPKTSK